MDTKRRTIIRVEYVLLQNQNLKSHYVHTRTGKSADVEWNQFKVNKFAEYICAQCHLVLNLGQYRTLLMFFLLNKT